MTTTETVTILFTDMVASTHLAARIGADAADDVRRTHFDLARGAIERTGGEEVKSTGDGLMVAFRSASQAVECAFEIVRALEAHRTVEKGHPEVRVAVSTGEATHEDGDWYGPPVVEAARLCDVAAPGQILVGPVAHAVVAGRGRQRLRPLEPLLLKGFDEPVDVWEVERPAARSAPLRVVLAEDSVLLREGVARVLQAADVDVVGQAGDVEGLMRLLERGPVPDVVVTDIRMPPTHTDEGIRAAKAIRSRYPQTGVLVLSQYLETP